MLEKLQELENKYFDLEKKLSLQEVINDQKKFKEYSKTYSDMTEIINKFAEYKKVLNHITESRFIIDNEHDKELITMAHNELSELEPKKSQIEKELTVLLLPKDPKDDKNTIVEIRAGTGGDESALFASELFRMYNRYAEKRKWKIEILSSNPTGIGGFKEIVFAVDGYKVFSRMKYESGTHRVQRVPATEAQGRVHTSAVTVAVLPEAEDVEIEIDPKDLRIDVYRSGGPGGQSVNTTDSAVRVTHIPTNMVVQCQDEKSQHKNKAKALRVLKARLLEKEQEDAEKERSMTRKLQVGSGDRSEKIRTYNFPQNRITDHRIGLTLYRLSEFMDGEIDDMIEALITFDQTEKLKNRASE
ncbi:MAG: peptide chain release factor 1 [Candidatus Firestonebacteria bacterium]|nr:peptide chain release factor 1 [Candidatus Firestonebacteria bacterium]